jgi:hypothetical protein
LLAPVGSSPERRRFFSIMRRAAPGDHPPVAYARDPEGNLLELPHWS